MISLLKTIKELFKIELYWFQEKFLKDCLDNKRIIGAFCRQCLDGETIIPLFKGDYKKLKDVKEGDEIFSFNIDSGKIEGDKVKKQWLSGKRQTYELKTYQNEKIICSSKHPFFSKWRSHNMVKKGWRNIEDGLSKRMCIASPNNLIGNEKIIINDDLCKILGYLIADGNYTSSVKFTNNSLLYLEEVEKICINNFRDITIKKYAKNKGWDYLLTGKRSNKKNSLSNFLKDIGIFGQKKDKKIIPELILKTKNSNIFLNRFYASDGWVSNKEIGISCTSLVMAEQLKYLLQKWGCKSYLTEEKNRRLQKSRFWKVRIADKISCNNFFMNIGLIYGKEKQSLRFIERLNIKTSRSEQGVIENEIRWLRVKKITKLDDRLTYDIETENNHNFIANNLIVHNTGKSTTISILSILEALRTPNGHIVIVGPTDRQAGELFRKITEMINKSPLFSEIISFTKREIFFKNGCRISAYPVGDRGETIRGISANVLILEEAGFIKDEIVNQVLIPMISSTDGKIIKIGTPFGMNHFYKSYTDENYKVHRYTWKEAVEVDHFKQNFIDEQKNNCTLLEFQTEYEAEFIPDQEAFFSYNIIN